MTRPRLEICVADADSLAAAIAGGADRIELCSALELGGLTPSPGLMALAARAPVPVYAMIRPRSGDFVFSPADVEAMDAEIDAVRAAGLAGVVLGASRPDGSLDEALLARLMARAGGLGSTLHRAFDLVPDFGLAVEQAVRLGFERILTSGGAPTALQGRAGIERARAAARGRIGIMAGAGLNSGNVAQLLDALPLGEIHASAGRDVPAGEPGAVRFGFAAPARRRTDLDEVAAIRAILDAR